MVGSRFKNPYIHYQTSTDMEFRTRKRLRRIDCDYASDNFYFITTFVKNRVKVFGEVVDGVMQLNDNGKIALQQFEWLSQHFSYVHVHASVVMPDHVHAVIEIRSGKVQGDVRIKPLPELVGAYKTTTSRMIRAHIPDFSWHRSFHDRIIRDTMEYHHVVAYIRDNPRNWERR
jgi:putative transposase